MKSQLNLKIVGLLTVLIVAVFAVSAHAQLEYRIGKRIQNASFSDSRSSELVCSMSLFFSVDPDDRLMTNGVNSGGVTKLDGRGLMSCKNDQGFTSELPILAEIDAELPKALRKVTTINGEDSVPSEVSFSANSSSFVIPREVNQIYDVYSLRTFSWDKSSGPGELSSTFRGARNDLVIGMKLTSRNSNLSELKVKNLRLSFDDQAPDLAERL